jgi:hypothetical protein
LKSATRRDTTTPRQELKDKKKVQKDGEKMTGMLTLFLPTALFVLSLVGGGLGKEF